MKFLHDAKRVSRATVSPSILQICNRRVMWNSKTFSSVFHSSLNAHILFKFLVLSSTDKQMSCMVQQRLIQRCEKELFFTKKPPPNLTTTLCSTSYETNLSHSCFEYCIVAKLVTFNIIYMQFVFAEICIRHKVLREKDPIGRTKFFSEAQSIALSYLFGRDETESAPQNGTRGTIYHESCIAGSQMDFR